MRKLVSCVESLYLISNCCLERFKLVLPSGGGGEEQKKRSGVMNEKNE